MGGVAISMSTLLLPYSEFNKRIYMWPDTWTIIGNVRTCELQGFFMLLGMGGVIWYMVSLCIYYTCSLTLRLSKETIAKKVEWFLHLLPNAIGWIFSMSLLQQDMINPHMFHPYCANNVYPYKCWGTEKNKCTRGSYVQAKRSSDVSLMFLIIAVSVIIVSLFLISATLVIHTCKSRKASTESNHEHQPTYQHYKKISKVVVVHSFLYIFSYIITSFPLVLNHMLFDAYFSPQTKRSLVLMITPLAGLLNFLTFAWGKVYGYRLLHPSISRKDAFKKMFGNQALSDESLFFSNLEMVDRNEQNEEEIDVDDYENMLKEEIRDDVVVELPNVAAAASNSIQREGQHVSSSTNASSSSKNDNSEGISFDISSLKSPAELSKASNSKKSLEGGFFYTEPNISIQGLFTRKNHKN
ncbi:predicted protein [Chaetoceros tenuissimus]|uniref:G-protein coupled receptors family 1 profile domain-containing protein n=1 Tax=Chaetoceros tenuissimus TaxID=426638 RepID=A0AAD3HB13_9STRA|nr:predicted protein [Chaetoceros tenuissimus]